MDHVALDLGEASESDATAATASVPPDTPSSSRSSSGGGGRCQVRVQAGARWMKVYETLGTHALVVGGGCGTVGVGGYTLGGGVGYLSRVYGLAVDNVISYSVVTADGRLVNATSTHNPDLYWALSGGGGGNFGVLVGVTFKCYRPPSRTVATASYNWRSSATSAATTAVLAFYSHWIAGLPDAMTAYAAITQEVIGVTFFYLGSQEAAEELLAPWQNFFAASGHKPTTASAVQSMTFLEFEDSQQGPGLGGGLRNTMSSVVVRDITPTVVEQLQITVDSLPISSKVLGYSGAYIMHTGGAVARVASNATAYPHRSATWVVGVEALWNASADDGLYQAWAEGATARLSALGSGSVPLPSLCCAMPCSAVWYGTVVGATLLSPGHR